MTGTQRIRTSNIQKDRQVQDDRHPKNQNVKRTEEQTDRFRMTDTQRIRTSNIQKDIQTGSEGHTVRQDRQMMYVLLFLPIKAKLLLIEERAKCFVFCGNNALAIKKIRLGGKGGGGARGGGTNCNFAQTFWLSPQ